MKWKITKQLESWVLSSAKTIAIGSGDETLAILSVAVPAILRGLNSAIATADSEVTIDLQPCAFDIVDHQRLLRRLACTFGVSCLRCFQFYLSGRTQSVKALNVTSFHFLSVFRRDLCLARLSFFIYTSLVPAIASILWICVKQFSNGTQEYVHFNMDLHRQSVALGSLADCAADTEDWFKDNRVKLNLGKSLLLYAVPQLHSSELMNPPLMVGDVTLPPSV